MRNDQQQLLLCLKAYAQGQTAANLIPELTAEDFRALHTLAALHKLEPVVYGTLGRAPEFCAADTALKALWRKDTMRYSAGQLLRTQRLVRLTCAMEQAGISYAVVKGAVCRQLYRQPELRRSGDEDIYIRLQQREACHKILEAQGFSLDGAADSSVTHWLETETGLHIELHTRLLEAPYDDPGLENYFASCLDETVNADTGCGTVCTLPHTAHLLYMVCHALKHFIGGGFGIRTVCDVAAFAHTYSGSLHADTLYAWLETVHGVRFFHQLLAIGREYLGFGSNPWERASETAGQDILLDSLDAGIYGQSSLSRRHSATMSVARVSGSKSSVLRTLFPKRQIMENRYPILKKHPVLLPVMWQRRLWGYIGELLTHSRSDSSAAQSLSLSKKRIEMLVKYEITGMDPRKSK